MSLLSLAGNYVRLRYSAIAQCRYTEVLDFLAKYYFGEEPVSRSLNLAPNGRLPREVRALLEERLREDSSLIVIEESSDKVIAAITSCVMTPEAERDSYICYKKIVEKHPNWGGLYKLHQEIYRDLDRFEMVGSDRVFDIGPVAVVPEFRKFRIANELIARTVSLARERGDCPVALAYPTTLPTFRILSRLDFEMLAKVNVSRIYFDGRPIVNDQDVFFKVMAKHLGDESLSDDEMHY